MKLCFYRGGMGTWGGSTNYIRVGRDVSIEGVLFSGTEVGVFHH